MSAHRDLSAALLALSAAARASVQHLAHSEEDAEAIHHLRVSLRKLRSSLGPARPLYGSGRVVRVEEELKAALDLTSELRDEEVLKETLGKLKVSPDTRTKLDAWMVGRARREQGIRGRTILALQDDLVGESGRLSRVLGKFETRLGELPKRDESPTDFTLHAVDGAIDRLDRRAELAKGMGKDEMHAVRIAAKKLRYVVSLLTGFTLDPETVKEQLSIIERGAAHIQKRFGALHDVDEAKLRMGRAWGLDREARLEILGVLEGRRVVLEKRCARELLAMRRAIGEARSAMPVATGPELEIDRDSTPESRDSLLEAAPAIEQPISDAFEESGDALTHSDAEGSDAQA